MGSTKGRPLWAGIVGIRPAKRSCPWPIMEDAVRTRAYFISLESGGQQPDKDWLQAEREFQAEAGQTFRHRTPLPTTPYRVFIPPISPTLPARAG
jgi:hypothetical protein